MAWWICLGRFLKPQRVWNRFHRPRRRLRRPRTPSWIRTRMPNSSRNGKLMSLPLGSLMETGAAKPSGMSKQIQSFVAALLLLTGALIGVQIGGASDKRLNYLSDRVETLSKFQEDSIAWRKQLVRNDDALAQWEKARKKELAFQEGVTSRLDLLNERMARMSCSVCLARRGSCKKFCTPPEPVKP